jgi:hypothetical protein
MPKFKQFSNAYLIAKTLPDTTGAVPHPASFFCLARREPDYEMAELAGLNEIFHNEKKILAIY